jgi:WhiB family transcriptional regulator, redox-sensing transcriptional regulator
MVSEKRYWIANPQWMQAALCRDEPPDRFYPKTPVGVASSVRMCAKCLVRTDCLAYALEHRIDSGIWGGRTPAQRSRMLRRARIGRGVTSERMPSHFGNEGA